MRERTILDQLADHARERVTEAEQRISLEEMKQAALEMAAKEPVRDTFAFEIIAEDFPYLEIAKEYEKAGADCISVLTEPRWFLGKDQYLKEIAANVSIPCLRKDFTVDPYMIYEAKVLGASAVLLICSVLEKEQLKEYLQIAEGLGLSALVEAHDEAEIVKALEAGARIIGVNNRNLKDFTVDTENSRKLRNMIPKEVLFVSESGVKTPEDVQKLREIGADAVLIGETLMRAADKSEALAYLKTGI